MPDAAFTVEVDGKRFVLPFLSLGNWRMFKTEFGLTMPDIVATVKVDGEDAEILNLDDPNVLVALIVAALQHERPAAPVSELVAEVDAMDLGGLSFPEAEAPEEAEADPTKGGDSEATGESAKSGSSEKRRKKPGVPS